MQSPSPSDYPLPEFGEHRLMMNSGTYAFQSASRGHDGRRIEYWTRVDGDGACLRRLIGGRMVSMMHCADPATVLAQFHFETLGRAEVTA